MDEEAIFEKIRKVRILIVQSNADSYALNALSWLADAVEDIVMTMKANELKAARQVKTSGRFEDL